MSTLIKFTTALCVASCAAAINIESATNQSPKSDFFSKAGIDCRACTPDMLDVVAPMNNWNFQYEITTGNLDA